MVLQYRDNSSAMLSRPYLMEGQSYGPLPPGRGDTPIYRSQNRCVFCSKHVTRNV